MEYMEVLSIVISLCGFILNVFTVVVIYRYKPLHKQITIAFIANQSIIDAAAAAFLFFTTLFKTDTVPRRAGYFADELLCRFWFGRIPMWSMFQSSIYGIVALTFERFLAVVYPVWHKTNFTRKKIIVIILCIWFTGTCYSTAFSLATSGINSEGLCALYAFYSSPGTKYLVSTIRFVFDFVFPLSILSYFYARMAFALRNKVSQYFIKNSTQDSGAPAENSLRHEKHCEVNSAKKKLKEMDKSKPNSITLPNIAVEDIESGPSTSVIKDLKRDSTETTDEAEEKHETGVKQEAVIERETENDSERETKTTRMGEVRRVQLSKHAEKTVHKTTTKQDTPNTSGELENKLKKATTPKIVSSMTNARRNIIKTLLIVDVGYVLCWSWSEIFVILYQFGCNQYDFDSVFYDFTVIMVFLSSCINPIIYCAQYKQFQRGVKWIFSRPTKITIR